MVQPACQVPAPSCPTRFTEKAKVSGSVIANGCTIAGTVETIGKIDRNGMLSYRDGFYNGENIVISAV